MSTRVWRSFLPVALLVAYVAVEWFHLVPFSFPAASLPGLAAIVVALVAHRRERELRASWLLVAAGVGCQITGDVLWNYYDFVLLIDPFPSVADAFYLSGLVFLLLGLLARVRRLTHGADRASLIDATIIATGAGVLTWVFLMAPLAIDPELTTTERLISLAYPVADILVVAVAARLLFAPGMRSGTEVLLLLGLLSLLFADTLYGYNQLTGGYTGGGAEDLGWIASYAFLGAAALHPRAWQVRLAAPASGRLPRGRFVLLAVASLLAPALLAVHSVRTVELNLLVIAASSASLFLLVLARMEGLVRQVQRQSAELERLAATDGLTGLANRRQWDLALPRGLAVARREGRPVCVALLDLDHFKRFNDEQGHLAGDGLLREAARVWSAGLRPGDLLARYGGEEFALLLPACTSGDAVALLEHLVGSTPAGQTCSIGVAEWDGRETGEELTARADAALYQAKRLGRARVVSADLRLAELLN